MKGPFRAWATLEERWGGVDSTPFYRVKVFERSLESNERQTVKLLMDLRAEH